MSETSPTEHPSLHSIVPKSLRHLSLLTHASTPHYHYSTKSQKHLESHCGEKANRCRESILTHVVTHHYHYTTKSPKKHLEFFNSFF